MSAFADVKLASALDGVLVSGSATVATDHTFNPMGYVTPGVAKWVDRAGGIAVGYPSLTLQVRPPSQASRVYKVTAKLTFPTLEQTSPSTATGIQPAPTKAYDCSAIMEFLLPERSTAAERLVLMNLCASLFGTTVNATDLNPSDSTGTPLRNAIYNFEQPY